MTIPLFPSQLPNRNTQNPAVFASNVDAFFTALPAFVTGANATAATMDAQVASATASAASASAAPATASTSTTSLSIAVGTKNFTIQTGKNIVPGMFVTAAYDTNNYMFGSVISYAGTALSINVIAVVGSGTYASWSIALSAPVTPLNNTINGAFNVNGLVTFSGNLVMPAAGGTISLARASDGALVGILGSRGSDEINLYNSGSSTAEVAVAGGTVKVRTSAIDRFQVDTAVKVLGFGGLVLDYSSGSSLQFYRSGVGYFAIKEVSGDMVFQSGTPAEVARFKAATGNFLLNTTTDDGVNKLQIAGTASINGVRHDVTTVNGAGSLRILKNVSAGSIASGSTAAGSALAGIYWTSGATLTATSAPAGTWKNITGGTIANGEFGEWLRIA